MISERRPVFFSIDVIFEIPPCKKQRNKTRDKKMFILYALSNRKCDPDHKIQDNKY